MEIRHKRVVCDIGGKNEIEYTCHVNVDDLHNALIFNLKSLHPVKVYIRWDKNPSIQDSFVLHPNRTRLHPITFNNPKIIVDTIYPRGNDSVLFISLETIASERYAELLDDLAKDSSKNIYTPLEVVREMINDRIAIYWNYWHPSYHGKIKVLHKLLKIASDKVGVEIESFDKFQRLLCTNPSETSVSLISYKGRIMADSYSFKLLKAGIDYLPNIEVIDGRKILGVDWDINEIGG